MTPRASSAGVTWKAKATWLKLCQFMVVVWNPLKTTKARTAPTAPPSKASNKDSIITETTTAIRPDEGHVHLYVNNQLVSMNYGLEQDIPVTTGTLVLRAEFV